ncbi:MAG: phage tail sheath family protein [Hyphomicrobiales bacterium]|nr:phage tail sheath family protein [Hyphomicrobiales bacterium]
MSEYLAPGVFVEEVSFRAAQIVPASTSMGGMVGPTRFGPAGVAPQLLTSFNDFLTYFGDAEDLAFSDGAVPNYSAYAAQTFFDNGGQQLYFARVYNNVANAPGVQTSPQQASLAIPGAGASLQLTFNARFLGSGGNLDVVLLPRLSQPLLQSTKLSGAATSGATYLLRVTNPPTTASALPGMNLPQGVTGIQSLMALATFAPGTPGTPAAGGNPGTPGTPDTYTFASGQPIFFTDQTGTAHVQQIPGTAQNPALATGIVPSQISPSGAVTVQTVSFQPLPNNAAGPVYSIPVGVNLRSLFGLPPNVSTLYATVTTATPPTFSATPTLNPGANLSTTITGQLGLLAMGSRVGDGNLYYCSYDVSIQRNGTTVFSAAAVDLDSGANNSLAKALPQNPTGSAAATQPLCAIYNGTPTAATLWPALYAAFDPAFLKPSTPGVAPSFVLHVGQATPNTTAAVTQGTDGASPEPVDYSGADAPNFGLAALESIDAVSIVICPAAAADPVNHQAVVAAMIAHCTKMLYRVAVIDSPKGAAIGDVQTFRSLFSDTRTALYYPWVSAASLGPSGGTILLPPSSFVAGLYAYTDITRGVHKAPANVVVQDALGLELSINTAQQEVLNPIGINCLRQFTWGGFRVWGARTLSSDPQWQYVNVRRYFLYLEHSLQASTSWVVFEPNGQALWGAVATTVSDFLYNEWREGHLFGATPAQAFFVRCDATTMTQDDLDNGRLICVIGVAPLEPAEFVIFRIGQYTATSTS